MNFNVHIDYVRTKMRKQCGIVAKIRHYVPSSVLFLYDGSNIRSIIPYGILVYGCENLTKNNFTKENFKADVSSKIHDSISDVFAATKIFTVHELYINELLKFYI